MAQFIAFFLFLIICGSSLVNTTPIGQNAGKINHQKISAIAHRLLQDLAHEQLASKSSNAKQLDSNEEDAEYLPIMDELYPNNDFIDKDGDDEKFLSEADDIDDIMSSKDVQALWNHLEHLQEFNEDLLPLIREAILNDRINTTENDF